MDVAAVLEKLILEDVRAGNVDAILQLKKFVQESQALLEIFYYDGNKDHAVGTIVLRDGITAIENGAFQNCTQLEKVIVPDGVTSIGGGTFSGCKSLTEINLPDSVTYISRSAFLKCTSLTEIKLPEGVTFIGRMAFEGCKNLVKITLPESLTSIGGSAFSGCSSLREINLPDGVTSIGQGAFWGCSGLKEINLPESITSIGSSAFSGCTNLTEVKLPGELNSIGNGAFKFCSSLREIKLPDNLTSIGSNTFLACSRLIAINFPESLISIGDDAFKHCISLKKISYYEKNEEILKQCFGDTWDELEKTVITPIIDAPSVLYYDGNKNHAVGTITLRDGITTIEKYAFEGCDKLEKVIVPDGVTTIDDWAFSGCSSLREINLPDGITSIGGATFYNCRSLTEIKLPESLTSISSSVFYGCTNLIELNLPNSVTSINSSAFNGCTNLTAIKFPDTLNSIGNCVFYNCRSFKKISYYKKVEKILKNYFGDEWWAQFEKIVIDAPPQKIYAENEFVRFAKERGIKVLTHFTRIENLPSIAEHGLLTRKNLDENSLTYSYNDSQRLDNLTNSLSLSVTFPNYRMFYSYRQSHRGWAVILLDAEKILANLPCAFHSTNAANNSERHRPLQDRMTLDAFKGMFYKGFRTERQLSTNETTDPQAEILCLADIPLEYFVGIVFETSARATEYQPLFPNIPCTVDNDYFAPRHDWAYWKVNYDYYYEEW